MLVRYAMTNGSTVIKQVKGLLGYRNVFFLDTPVRQAEKKMNDHLAGFKKAYAEREIAMQQVEEAKKYIKGSTDELMNTSQAIQESLGFTGWLKSFVPLALAPKQSKDWEAIAKTLKKSSQIQTSAKSLKLSLTPVGHMQIKPNAGGNKNGGKKKGKGGNNNQQDQNQQNQ